MLEENIARNTDYQKNQAAIRNNISNFPLTQQLICFAPIVRIKDCIICKKRNCSAQQRSDSHGSDKCRYPNSNCDKGVKQSHKHGRCKCNEYCRNIPVRAGVGHNCAKNSR